MATPCLLALVIFMTHISIVQGDITQARVDAIVNAANSRMLGGGGVDGAIHRAAGPELIEACKAVPVVNGIRCPVGEAKITVAGNLPAKWVIHTVGPQYFNDSNPADHLASAYRSSLKLAQDHQCKSIAFPAISCGVYGYPFDEAANIAICVCSDAAFAQLDIRFFLMADDITAAWRKALA